MPVSESDNDEGNILIIKLVCRTPNWSIKTFHEY